MNEKPLDVEPFEIYFDHAIEDKELICELTKHSSVLYAAPVCSLSVRSTAPARRSIT